MVNELILRLKKFAKQDFPVHQVSNYLKCLPLNDKSLKKYVLFRNEFYTRNLIHKEKNFEILAICWPQKTDAPIQISLSIPVSCSFLYAHNLSLPLTYLY